MKVLVIGAGAQGGPAACLLAGEDEVSEVRLGDIDPALAQKVAQHIGERTSSDKVRPLKLDAGQPEEVVAAARGVDVIVNLTHLKFNEVIKRAALVAGTHYVDTACSTAFLERWIAEDEPELQANFQAIGKTALVGCGFAPGIANLLVRQACDQLERVERIVIRAGRKSAAAEEEVVSEWKPTWSPEILLEDYSEPPMLLIDGHFRHVPIFSNPETYTFPEPVGALQLSSHMHEEPYLIPKFYLDKGLRFLDFKYPVDKLAGAFIKMGLASEEPIEVDGLMVAPKDVLMKLVKRPGNNFLLEDEQFILGSDLTGILVVEVEGQRDGRPVRHTLSYRFVDGLDHERQRALLAAYGTTMVYVALPAVVGAKLCASGQAPSGVISPDSLDPACFFEEMSGRGVAFGFDEVVKELSR
jgi:saccharopine dehydrogenase-like NADP-dependent oxidoreductase